MSDPELDPTMKRLFEAARAETPSAAAKAKAMASLGLSAGAAAGAAGAAASTGVPAVIKGAVVALLVGASFGAGMLVGQQSATQPPPIVVNVQAPPPAPQLEAQPEPPPKDPERELEQAVPPEAVPVNKPKAPKADDADALAQELAALDRARTLLREGNAAGALQAVSAYEKQFPTGTLAPEATLVRLEALLASGKREQAEALAKKFLAQHRSELLQQRVQRLLDAK